MIWSAQEDVCRLYANTIPFYAGNMSILQFWYLRVSQNQSPMNAQG